MKKKEKIITTLIKNDLINYKLVAGLNLLGMEASGYYLYLNEPIFKLLGFKKHQITDVLYDQYNQLCLNVLTIDVLQERKKLDALAEEMYEVLKGASVQH